MQPWVLLLVASLAISCNRSDPHQYVDELKRITARAPEWVDRDELGTRVWRIERDFYAQRAYLPAWIDGRKPTAQLDELLAVLREAKFHGLDPAGYGHSALASEREKAEEALIGAAFEDARIPEIDARATYAFLRHGAELLGWSASPRDIDRNWLWSPVKEDLARRLSEALDGNRVHDVIEQLAPSHAQYQGLRAALKRMSDPSHPPADNEAARWQLEQIRMNLQRWRWMPRDLGPTHILINVPAYELQVVEEHKPVLAMRVIVGQPDWRTPIFSDEMTYVVFSPSWNIPDNILREETLPRVANDPDFLTRNNIEVVGTSGDSEPIDPESIDWSDESATSGLRFRQRPGPDNALGLVKFIFPNNFNVYFHDTPGDRLFNKQARALSHGCIRVEQPAALAEYMLSDRPEWTNTRIATAMNNGREQAITLKRRLPVHIGYWTAWVNPDGGVRFFDDPYGYDRAQARLTQRRGALKQRAI